MKRRLVKCAGVIGISLAFSLPASAQSKVQAACEGSTFPGADYVLCTGDFRSGRGRFDRSQIVTPYQVERAQFGIPGNKIQKINKQVQRQNLINQGVFFYNPNSHGNGGNLIPLNQVYQNQHNPGAVQAMPFYMQRY